MTRNQWYAHAGAADAFFSAPFSPFVGAISVVATFLKSFRPDAHVPFVFASSAFSDIKWFY